MKKLLTTLSFILLAISINALDTVLKPSNESIRAPFDDETYIGNTNNRNIKYTPLNRTYGSKQVSFKLRTFEPKNGQQSCSDIQYSGYGRHNRGDHGNHNNMGNGWHHGWHHHHHHHNVPLGSGLIMFITLIGAYILIKNKKQNKWNKNN